ncbi:hypothetical protein I302_105997 [Kwoniella bestiolae CBS 10118]|uniref:CRA domain-containing protein n=1 Tax=Kwoniella bestiolae CBS 10118 TaxID=1296100 RepID=A0A1B9G2R3_9TREE|nr:hypothetical protein I302_05121 [Kwoniella bestiolae CBS 10118]OCF25307.1 hypothetical protein I302_05121 [Kwoniella bestiolae CBS 10118]
MNGSSSSSSSSSLEMYSLHDIILNYVETSAYASTARILAQTQSQTKGENDGEIPENGDGNVDDGDGEGEDSMDIDQDDEDDDDARVEAGLGVSDRKAGKSPEKKKRRVRFGEGDLEGIERRREILNHILNGSIPKSVHLLNTHFPSVLDETLPQISNGHSHSLPSSSRPTYQPPNHAIPVLPNSTDPAHIKLNLQFQEFIEHFRQLNPSTPSSPSSSIGSLNGSGSTGSGSTNLTNALIAAQGLHAEAKRLPPEIRAIFLKEINDAGALFAYSNPETSILSGFLDQERRIRLSEMVNGAILKSQNKPTQSALETFARRTTVLYKLMNDHGIDPKPISMTDGLGSQGGEKGKEHLEEYFKQSNGRPFNLHEFVNSTW